MATGPTFGQHELELVLVLVRVVVNFEREVGDFFGQPLEVVGQLRTVLDQDVTILTVREVILEMQNNEML